MSNKRKHVYVKFELDKKEFTVPIEHIEDYDTEVVKVSQVRQVFWSDDVDLTPDSVMENEGYIAKIKKLPSRKKNDDQGYETGWYEGEILLIAGSKEELQQSLENKRLKKLTSKVKEQLSNSERGKNSHSIKKTGPKALLKQSTEINLKRLNTGNEKNNSSSSSDDSDDSVGSTKGLKEQVKLLQQQLVNSRKKLKMYSQKAESEPYEIGDEEMELQNETSKDASVDKSVHKAGPSKEIQPNDHTKKKTSEQSESDDELKENVQPLLRPSKKQAVLFQNEAEDENTISDSDEDVLDVENKANDFRISESKLQLIELGIDCPGPMGDSRFIKDVAVAVFGRKTLATSSLRGATCRANPSIKPKPRLDKHKVAYVKALLQYRVEKEGAVADLGSRLKKFRKCLRDKLGTEHNALAKAKEIARKRKEALENLRKEEEAKRSLQLLTEEAKSNSNED